MAAPPMNRNATRHGLRAGRLPKGAAYVRRECDALRRIIEDAVADANNGNVTLHQAALIQTAIRWERHAMLAQRWLRLQIDDLDANARLNYSRDIARASAERDKCFKELGLNTICKFCPSHLILCLLSFESRCGESWKMKTLSNFQLLKLEVAG